MARKWNAVIYSFVWIVVAVVVVGNSIIEYCLNVTFRRSLNRIMWKPRRNKCITKLYPQCRDVASTQYLHNDIWACRVVKIYKCKYFTRISDTPQGIRIRGKKIPYFLIQKIHELNETSPFGPERTECAKPL